ncbi:unnamed protein product, partial [Allacma fusca]
KFQELAASETGLAINKIIGRKVNEGQDIAIVEQPQSGTVSVCEIVEEQFDTKDAVQLGHIFTGHSETDKGSVVQRVLGKVDSQGQNINSIGGEEELKQAANIAAKSLKRNVQQGPTINQRKENADENSSDNSSSEDEDINSRDYKKHPLYVLPNGGNTVTSTVFTDKAHCSNRVMVVKAGNGDITGDVIHRQAQVSIDKACYVTKGGPEERPAQPQD